MAVTDAYAEVSDYKDRVGKTGTGDDTELESQLSAASRFIDRECGYPLRFFGQDASAVNRIFDGNGSTRLYITDLATLTGLIVKVDLDADYDFDDSDETLTINTHFWAGPANVELGSEPSPYLYLDIVPNNGRLARWPEQKRALQVTGAFGWPSVPAVVLEATVDLVRKMRDIQESGAAEVLQNIDLAMQTASRQSFVFQDMRRRYRRADLFA